MATAELNRNFASAIGVDGLPVYALAYIMMGGRLKLHPTAEDYAALAKAQQQYERDEQAHLAELGALIEEIYNEDLEAIDNV